jgi:hypothetical protein
MSFQLTNNIAGLGADNIRFISWLSSSGHRTSTAASISLGRVIGCKLAFCPEALNNIGDITLSFNMRCSEETGSIIDAVNELIIIDRKAVMDYAKQVWCWRHHQAVMPAACYGTDNTKRLRDFFGIGYIFSETGIKCIEECAESLPYLTSGFEQLVATIHKPSAGV